MADVEPNTKLNTLFQWQTRRHSGPYNFPQTAMSSFPNIIITVRAYVMNSRIQPYLDTRPSLSRGGFPILRQTEAPFRCVWSH